MTWTSWFFATSSFLSKRRRWGLLHNRKQSLQPKNIGWASIKAFESILGLQNKKRKQILNVIVCMFVFISCTQILSPHWYLLCQDIEIFKMWTFNAQLCLARWILSAIHIRMLDILRGLDFCFSILTIFKSFQLFGNFDGFTRTSTIHVSGLSPKRRSFKVRFF